VNKPVHGKEVVHSMEQEVETDEEVVVWEEAVHVENEAMNQVLKQGPDPDANKEECRRGGGIKEGSRGGEHVKGDREPDENIVPGIAAGVLEELVLEESGDLAILHEVRSVSELEVNTEWEALAPHLGDHSLVQVDDVFILVVCVKDVLLTGGILQAADLECLERLKGAAAVLVHTSRPEYLSDIQTRMLQHNLLTARMVREELRDVIHRPVHNDPHVFGLVVPTHIVWRVIHSARQLCGSSSSSSRGRSGRGLLATTALGS